MNTICVLNDNELEHGNFGDIKISLCLIKDAENIVKCEFLNKKKFKNQGSYMKERNIHQGLSTYNLKNIAMMIFADDNKLEIYYKMVSGPTLSQLFNNFFLQNNYYTLIFFGFVIRQVASAIYSVNTSGIVLNNLDKDKLVLDNNNNIIIFDLDNAENEKMEYQGPPNKSGNLAPECMNPHKASIQQDVFCLGFLIYDLLCFPDAPNPKQLTDVQVFEQMNLVFDTTFTPSHLQRSLYKIFFKITQCMSLNPTDRPTTEEIFTYCENYHYSFPHNYAKTFQDKILITGMEERKKYECERITEERQKREEAEKLLQEVKIESNKLSLEVERLEKELEELKKEPEKSRKEKVANKVQKVNEIPPPLKGYEK